MGLGEMLSKEVKSYGVLAIIIVIISIILLKFKVLNIKGINCPGSTAAHLFFNSTSNLCCEGTSLTAATNCITGNTSSIATTGAGIDLFVTGFSEPSNWIAIIIIALVGFGLLYYFTKKKS